MAAITLSKLGGSDGGKGDAFTALGVEEQVKWLVADISTLPLFVQLHDPRTSTPDPAVHL